MTTPESVLAEVEAVARSFAASRIERLGRTALDPRDFEAIAGTGYLDLAVPVRYGGAYTSPAGSVRGICQCLRTLATGDPSVALVSAMHPGVLGFWAAVEENPPAPFKPAFDQQCETLFGAARQGQWFGTIASEPGAGGDLQATRCTASPLEDGSYAISGDKFMGSGSGITSYMLTVARPDGEEDPDIFVFDTRNTPWDGSTGVTMTREWDGAGMPATQSHAFRFEAASAERYGWPRQVMSLAPRALGVVANTFSAVAIGILDAAMT